MTRYAIALGSNLGNRLRHLQQGVAGLSSLGTLTAVAGLYETAPVGGPAQDPYLNSVAVLETKLGPADLLAALHELEAEADRERENRWGPRTLDLDIVASDGLPVDTPTLVIPHPRAGERRFVLEPLSSIWPEAVVASATTAREALGAVADQEVVLLSREWSDPTRTRPGRYWVAGQMVWFVAIAIALFGDGAVPDRLSTVAQWAGGLLALAGGLLAFFSLRALGSALTAVPEPLESASMVDTGPYRYARHPIYGGIVLFLLGAALLLSSALGALLSVGLAGFFWLKSGYEERQLRIAYSGYGAYQARVRRRVIPFVI